MKIIVTILVVLLGASVFLVSQKWRRTAALVMQLPPCLEIGGPLHHFFKPNCKGAYTFNGEEIAYAINEIGLRERPLRDLLVGQVLVLGDSMIEGWGLPWPDTIPQKLEQNFWHGKRWQFLNAGIRSTGPIVIGARIDKLVTTLKPARAILFLTENHLLDERLAHALAKVKDDRGIPL